jgi:hypothetical protein
MGVRTRCYTRLVRVLIAAAAAFYLSGSTADHGIAGVWSFATLTPLERAAEFAGKPTLTDAEAEAYARDTIERGDRDRRDGGAAIDVARAVNDYWFERGTDLAALNGRKLSSLIVDLLTDASPL